MEVWSEGVEMVESERGGPLYPAGWSTCTSLSFCFTNRKSQPWTLIWFGNLDRRLRSNLCTLLCHNNNNKFS